MKKILIALDYGPTSRKVAEIGYSFAKPMNADVVLLHVLADITYYATPAYSTITGFTNFDVNEFNQMIDIEGLKKAGAYFLNKIKIHLGDENVQTLIEEGDDLSGTIIKAAEHVHADVIVMGSHSRRWLEQIFMGSVTEDVLDKSTVPLLIIPVKEIKVK